MKNDISTIIKYSIEKLSMLEAKLDGYRKVLDLERKMGDSISYVTRNRLYGLKL